MKSKWAIVGVHRVLDEREREAYVFEVEVVDLRSLDDLFFTQGAPGRSFEEAVVLTRSGRVFEAAALDAPDLSEAGFWNGARRVVFHSAQVHEGEPLSSPMGDLSLPPLSPIPERVSDYVPIIDFDYLYSV